MTIKDNEDFRALVNVGSVIILMLMVILKYKITVTSLENIEVQHIEIVILTLNF